MSAQQTDTVRLGWFSMVAFPTDPSDADATGVQNPTLRATYPVLLAGGMAPQFWTLVLFSVDSSLAVNLIFDCILIA